MTDKLLGGKMMNGIQVEGKIYIAEPDVREAVNAALATNTERNDRIAALERELSDSITYAGQLKQERDDLKADYLRRHNDAVDRGELLREWLHTEMDPQDDEYGPWIESFTERVNAALATEGAALSKNSNPPDQPSTEASAARAGQPQGELDTEASGSVGLEPSQVLETAKRICADPDIDAAMRRLADGGNGVGNAGLDYLRSLQAKTVMPLIGPLLDAWERMPNDERSEALEPFIAAIDAAMTAEQFDMEKAHDVMSVHSQCNSGEKP